MFEELMRFIILKIKFEFYDKANCWLITELKK
jgi:hypothetical protein